MCSSPSFGCFRLRSGRGLQESPPVLVRDCFRFAFGLSGAPQTRACVRLLGPCFKTGRRGDSPPNACISGARYSCLAGAGRPRPNADEPRRPQRDPTSPHFRHTPTRRSPTCPPVRGRPSAARQSSSRRRTKVELALTVSFDFGRFRVLFDSLFRVLFDCPSQYLFALGLAVGVEPRVERTTLLRAAISSNPTLEPKTSNAIRFYSHACDGPDARSGHGPCRGVSDVLS